jgi:hypothetical protein
MDPAATVLQHDAFVVVFLDQGKPLPVRPQASVAGNEILLRDPKVAGNALNLPLIEPYVTRPFAAGITTLADVIHPGLQDSQVVSRASKAIRLSRKSAHSSFW